MDEKAIQNAIFRLAVDCRQRLITPNVHLYGRRESDILTVSDAGFVTEYEIKISRADFLADFRRKARKHSNLRGASAFKSKTPNYFYFAIPSTLTPDITGDIPAYAGLAVVDECGRATIAARAPRLHNLKASDRDIEYLSRGLMLRYWQTRCNIA